VAAELGLNLSPTEYRLPIYLLVSSCLINNYGYIGTIIHSFRLRSLAAFVPCLLSMLPLVFVLHPPFATLSLLMHILPAPSLRLFFTLGQSCLFHPIAWSVDATIPSVLVFTRASILLSTRCFVSTLRVISTTLLGIPCGFSFPCIFLYECHPAAAKLTVIIYFPALPPVPFRFSQPAPSCHFATQHSHLHNPLTARSICAHYRHDSTTAVGHLRTSLSNMNPQVRLHNSFGTASAD
jgi:hypothetical protein